MKHRRLGPWRASFDSCTNAHPERFVQGPPRPETLPTAVWINRPTKPTREDAPGATPVTPGDPQHGVIRRAQPICDDRPITLVTSVGSLQ